MTRNIFVLGLTELQRRELDSVRGAHAYTFHELLDYESLVHETDYDLEKLLARARQQLADFDGHVDAIVAHWDFPSSIIGPLLSAEHGLPAPSLPALLKCEHKYWSRLEQMACVPEVVPRFASFDPFAEDVLEQIGMEFPYWVKPVKAHSSELGFAIHSEADLREALQEIREQIADVGDAFDQALSRVDLPAELEGAGGNSCLAEQIITGIQAAPEGTVFDGEFHVHGVFDMHRDEDGTSIARLDYPASTIPESVQQRMVDVARRFMDHIGYDNAAFNVEYMWDRDTDQLWLIEVNTRISQSHSDLFAKVDGASNHEVVIDMALGRKPSMPHRQGPYAVAAKAAIFHDEDAIVTRVPSEEDKQTIREEFPETVLTTMVQPGDRLSELAGQDSYRYVVGKAYIGADNREELLARHAAIQAEAPFEFQPVKEESRP